MRRQAAIRLRSRAEQGPGDSWPFAFGWIAACAQCLPVLPKPPAPRALCSNSSTTIEMHLQHRHDHQLRDALHRLERERCRCRGSRPRRRSVPGSPSRSARPDCPSTMPCLWPRPERGSTIGGQPGSARWIAMPEWDQLGLAGLQLDRLSIQARRSRPAEPGSRRRAIVGQARVQNLDVDGAHRWCVSDDTIEREQGRADQAPYGLELERLARAAVQAWRYA